MQPVVRLQLEHQAIITLGLRDQFLFLCLNSRTLLSGLTREQHLAGLFNTRFADKSPVRRSHASLLSYEFATD